MMHEYDDLNYSGEEGFDPRAEFGDLIGRMDAALGVSLPETLGAEALFRRFEGLLEADATAEEGGLAETEGQDAPTDTEDEDGGVIRLDDGRKARKPGWTMSRILAAAACLALGFVGVRHLGAQGPPPIEQPAPAVLSEPASSAAPASAGPAEDYSALRNTLYDIQKEQGYYYVYNKDNAEGGMMNPNTSGAMPAPEAAPMAPMMDQQMLTGGGDASMRIGGWFSPEEKNVYATNTQEKGIDEADIIKTDGTYLYVYRYNAGTSHHEIRIVQASNLKHMSTIDLGSASPDGSLYLDGDRMVLVRTREAGEDVTLGENARSTAGALAGNTRFEAEAPEPDRAASTAAKRGVVATMPGFARSQQVVEVVVYDIAKRNEPKEVASYLQDGGYLTSRYMNGVIYTVTNKSVYDRVISSDLPMARLVPMVGSGGQLDILPAQNIIVSDYLAEPNYVTVTATDIRSGDRETMSVLGVANTLYMSEKALYLTATTYDYNRINQKPEDSYNHTGIVKLSVDGVKLTHVGGAQVDGYVDGQFAFSEKDGYLRVATTADSERGSRNNLYVLDSGLKLTGSLTDLAPGERIYSVRYMGDMGYVVTFKQVDPLFAIDLKDPKNPKVLGELKIPGFSEYLHPIDDKTLLGFGYNTQQNAWGGVTTDGLKLSLFDVADPKQPKETQSYAIGNSGSSSPALMDHKAFMYYPERSMVGLPVTVYTASATGGAGESFSGLLLFEVKSTGFKLYGQIASRQPDNAGFGRYDSSFEIQRGAYIGDIVYTFSDGCIMSHRLKAGMPKVGEYLFDA